MNIYTDIQLTLATQNLRDNSIFLQKMSSSASHGESNAAIGSGETWPYKLAHDEQLKEIAKKCNVGNPEELPEIARKLNSITGDHPMVAREMSSTTRFDLIHAYFSPWGGPVIFTNDECSDDENHAREEWADSTVPKEDWITARGAFVNFTDQQHCGLKYDQRGNFFSKDRPMAICGWFVIMNDNLPKLQLEHSEALSRGDRLSERWRVLYALFITYLEYLSSHPDIFSGRYPRAKRYTNREGVDDCTKLVMVETFMNYFQKSLCENRDYTINGWTLD